MIENIERIRDALHFIPASDRNTWVQMGMAVKSELGEAGFEPWEAWSQQAESFDPKAARDVWKSIRADGKVTAGTLFHEAKARGWRDDGKRPKPIPKDIAEQQRINAERAAQADAEQRARHDAARDQAAAILEAATGDPETHPYAATIKKGVPLGPRVKRGAWPQRGWRDALLVPIYQADGLTWSVEAINVDRQKDSLKDGKKSGGLHHFGQITGAKRVLLGEGLATVAAAVDADGSPAATALARTNLKAVGLLARELAAPDAEIIFLADNDPKPNGTNPGLEAAIEAARSCGGVVAVTGIEGKSDFWDLWASRGPDAVREAIEKALQAPQPPAPSPTPAPAASSAPAGVSDRNGWPDPHPLTAKIEPEPYPLDALPLPIRAAVEEVAGFVKAPVPMVASSALAALSLAIQAHADAKRLEKLHGPVGLFILVIADSGERKSTCDGFFTKTISDYEEAQAEAAKPALKDHRAAIEAWEAKRGGVKEKIRQLAKEQKSTAGMESALRDLEHDKPEPPRIPRLLYADATPEALAYGLAKQWPSGGVVSAEAGIVFGSHGMGKDSVMRNLGLLNQLWDGKSLTIDRRSTESFTVRGARLTVALQVQEPTLREFFTRSGALARGTGFLARFLVAWPESTQGMRQIDPDAPDGPATWPHLAAFHRCIAAILDQPAPINEDGALTPPMLPLTPEAKAAWVDYHNAIESELSSGGELYDVRDVASKSADNAARLAALFQMFEGAGGAIGLTAFESASLITAWHLHESRRFFGELALPAELADAARLDAWLIEYCRRKSTLSVGKNHVRQHGPLRDGKRLDGAIRELAALDRLKLDSIDKHLTISLNPALVGVV